MSGDKKGSKIYYTLDCFLEGVLRLQNYHVVSYEPGLCFQSIHF